jgi:hypothetical protein
MGVPDDPSAGWHGVPDEHLPAWRDVFRELRAGLDVDAACPVCGVRALHVWFHRDSPRRGSGWVWCSNCRCYEHYSCTVPDSWQSSLKVDPDLLMHHPEPIEQARRALTGESRG